MGKKNNVFYEDFKGILEEFFNKIFDEYPKKPNSIQDLIIIISKFGVA